ncbi:hypothetical protein KFZ70_04190 [Tamlana fucoidanivorans]|uniref:Uncharacterized protein n=1 Tax=Allotamlana fucoidanivorans TaxID=2583814 RepID=A0A5C4SD99_9FLAO|nr:hypothetical protein [Tamlana fucoidanivorans]TNJ41356.1 hypothetical protein FGF67_16110 [Tamlana fucoidanivorans]
MNTGEQLFFKHTRKRDFLGNAHDVYAQLLETLMVHLGDDLFPLLEEAELLGKQLYIIEQGIQDEYTVNDVGFKTV